MTTATVWIENKTVMRVKATGHSGYASSGTDIVCSSISTAMIMTANLLERFTTSFDVNTDEKTVTIDIIINESNDIVSNVMKNLEETLVSISSQYPKYFQIKYLKNN